MKCNCFFFLVVCIVMFCFERWRIWVVEWKFFFFGDCFVGSFVLGRGFLREIVMKRKGEICLKLMRWYGLWGLWGFWEGFGVVERRFGGGVGGGWWRFEEGEEVEDLRGVGVGVWGCVGGDGVFFVIDVIVFGLRLGWELW